MRFLGDSRISFAVGFIAALIVPFVLLVALIPKPGAVVPDEIAAQFGVTVQVVSETPCGLAGCFLRATPDTIYIEPGFDGEELRYLILHEIGHVIQHRLGIPLDECGADRFAQSMGSTFGAYCAPE